MRKRASKLALDHSPRSTRSTGSVHPLRAERTAHHVRSTGGAPASAAPDAHEDRAVFTPDIVLPSLANESKDIGESALDNPMPWDTIPGAKFDKLNLVEPYVPELRKRSNDRISSDRDFAYLREDIELFKKQQADKTISLNEKQRLKEKEELEARAKL